MRPFPTLLKCHLWVCTILYKPGGSATLMVRTKRKRKTLAARKTMDFHETNETNSIATPQVYKQNFLGKVCSSTSEQVHTATVDLWKRFCFVLKLCERSLVLQWREQLIIVPNRLPLVGTI